MLLAGAFAVIALGASPQAFVLLEPGTTLLPPLGITPDAGTDHPACCEAGAVTIAARFIADDGELVQIETLGSAADPAVHCGATFYDDGWFPHMLGSYRIRAWVKRSALVPVNKRPIKTAHAEVAAGVPVEVLDGGALRFGIYGSTREFTLPAGSAEVSQTYVPGRWARRKTREAKADYRLRIDVFGAVGDGGVVPLAPGEHWPVPSVKRVGDQALIPVEARCARLKALVPFSALMVIDGGLDDSWGSTHLCGHICQLRTRPGSTVYWPDGRVAGTTSGDGACGPGGSKPGAGGTECFNITLQGLEGSLPLCFRPADLGTHYLPQ